MDARTQCPNCGSSVEALAYCGVCGRAIPQRQAEPDPGWRGRVEQAIATVREQPQRTFLIAAAVIIFLVLLSGNAALAAIIGLLVVPCLVVNYLTRLDLFEREPWTLMAGVVGTGAAAGLVGGWLSSLVFDRLWFGDTRLNIGAVGFPGIVATGEGSVPFSVLLINGILIPVLFGAAVLGGPVFLRRWSVFRNEVLDGFTLGALAAAGFATLSAAVYFWPAVLSDLPDRPVSDWTAIVAGIGVIRPIVMILSGAMLGAAIWQYSAKRKLTEIAIPAAGGLAGWLGLALGSLIVMPSGAVTEFIWYAVILAIVGFVFREALSRGLAQDREQLQGEDGSPRFVCPNCHRLTPDGLFCSYCGADLRAAEPVAIDAGRTERATVSAPSSAVPMPSDYPEPVDTTVASSGADRAAFAEPEPSGAGATDGGDTSEADWPDEHAEGTAEEEDDSPQPDPHQSLDYPEHASVPDEGEPAWLTDALADDDADVQHVAPGSSEERSAGEEPAGDATGAEQARDSDAGGSAASDERTPSPAPFSWRTIREDANDGSGTPVDGSGESRQADGTRWQWSDEVDPADDAAPAVDADEVIASAAADGGSASSIDEAAASATTSDVSSSSGRWFSTRPGPGRSGRQDGGEAGRDDEPGPANVDRSEMDAHGDDEMSRMADEGGPVREMPADADAPIDSTEESAGHAERTGSDPGDDSEGIRPPTPGV